MVAIVGQDATALRAAPRDSAPQQAVLWQGTAWRSGARRGISCRCTTTAGERAGYVRASQVRTPSLKEEAAPELLDPGAVFRAIARAAKPWASATPPPI